MRIVTMPSDTEAGIGEKDIKNSRSEKKWEETERATSSSSFLVPRGPFGLIAGRLECLSYRTFSFLLKGAFFVVAL